MNARMRYRYAKALSRFGAIRRPPQFWRPFGARYGSLLMKSRNKHSFYWPFEVGAGGGTRTHTTFYSPRILSPVRLPFRHTGNRLLTSRFVMLPTTKTFRATICATMIAPNRSSHIAITGNNFAKVPDGRKQPIRGPGTRHPGFIHAQSSVETRGISRISTMSRSA